jgi:hypothetical protein
VIKFVFRWAFRLVLLAIVLAVALVLLKDTLARGYAEAQIRRETGFDAKIGKLQVSLFSPTITIENFVLYNPAEFGGSAFLDVPELHLEYNRNELAFQRFHLKLLRLNVREMNIVQDMQGRTNIVELMQRVSDDPEMKKHRDKQEYTFTGVDMLNLTLGKIRFTNLRIPARNHEIDLALQNEIVPNVRSEQDLAGIFFKVLLRAGITIYLDHKEHRPQLHSRD